MSDEDLRTLLRLLDTMDDHFDQRITDQEFLTGRLRPGIP